MYELELKAKGVDVKLCAVFLGSDLLVWLTGGAAHIGAVTVAVPRPSLSENGGVSADVSIIATGGHKEDLLARKIALALAGKLNVKVSVVAGMHWDDITEEQLSVAQAISAKLAKNLLEQIAAGGPLPVAALRPAVAVAETAADGDEPPRPKYVSIKADLNTDIKPGQTAEKPAPAPKPPGVKTGTGSGPGAKPVVGKPISIKPGATKSISISTGSGRLVPKPSSGKPLPGVNPETSKPLVSRPSESTPAARPEGRPVPKPGARPAPRPGARPAPRPGARPAPKPGTRPAGAPQPVKKSPPEFDE